MDSTTWFINMKIILIFAFVALTGCGNSISEREIIESIKFCESNGGLKYIYVGDMYSVAHCSNGGRFDLKRDK